MKRAIAVLLALILVGNLMANTLVRAEDTEKTKKKIERVTAVATIALSIFSLFCPAAAPWAISKAIHAFVIDVSNDITVASYSYDNKYAQRVSPSTLTLDRAVTDYPEFPESVNEALNVAINTQLYHASLLGALATATNRYYTALNEGDSASAKMQTEDILSFFNEADQVEDSVAEKFENVAIEQQNTGSDIPKPSETNFTDFQTYLSTEGLPQGMLDVFDMLIPNIDPILLAKIDPIENYKNLVLSLAYEELPPSMAIGTLEAADYIRLISSVIGPFPGIPSVGGIWIPVDKFGLLAPYICLASITIIAIVATAVSIKRVKQREEKQ